MTARKTAKTARGLTDIAALYDPQTGATEAAVTPVDFTAPQDDDMEIAMTAMFRALSDVVQKTTRDGVVYDFDNNGFLARNLCGTNIWKLDTMLEGVSKQLEDLVADGQTLDAQVQAGDKTKGYALRQVCEKIERAQVQELVLQRSAAQARKAYAACFGKTYEEHQAGRKPAAANEPVVNVVDAARSKFASLMGSRPSAASTPGPVTNGTSVNISE